ncbi:hypothetical protein C8R44DRAFT_827603 [Mycena epipterygia]|nr:hypothetical protein C8R44DRAFT_827603 [Mycena epipterygia]
MAKKKNENKTKKKQLRVGSPFMQLPLELRLEIYSHFFFSTRLAWGERALGRTERQRITHAPNALALLRTCRQVRAEVRTTWLQQVLFSFESPEAMLDKLANIPTTTLKLIRHARVSGTPLMLSWEDDSVYYRTSQALKLLPGLALERLTVLGVRGPEVRYDTLDKLVRHGTGWNELYYLSHDSTFLAYERDWIFEVGAPDEYRYLRAPQPVSWQRVLDARDGPTSGASVTIYRATVPRQPGAVLHPATRVAFAQTLPAGGDLLTFGKVADSTLMAPGERDKEVLVVVKRGRDVNYAERKDSPYLEGGDIREDKAGMTWKQIKAEQDRLHQDDDDDLLLLELGYEEEEEPPVVDEYIHVDEYVWPPLHFSAK